MVYTYILNGNRNYYIKTAFLLECNLCTAVTELQILIPTSA